MDRHEPRDTPHDRNGAAMVSEPTRRTQNRWTHREPDPEGRDLIIAEGKTMSYRSYRR